MVSRIGLKFSYFWKEAPNLIDGTDSRKRIYASNALFSQENF